MLQITSILLPCICSNRNIPRPLYSKILNFKHYSPHFFRNCVNSKRFLCILYNVIQVGFIYFTTKSNLRSEFGIGIVMNSEEEQEEDILPPPSLSTPPAWGIEACIFFFFKLKTEIKIYSAHTVSFYLSFLLNKIKPPHPLRASLTLKKMGGGGENSSQCQG